MAAFPTNEVFLAQSCCSARNPKCYDECVEMIFKKFIMGLIAAGALASAPAETLILPKFDSIDQWKQVVLAYFSGSKLIWISEISDGYISLIAWKGNLYVCTYPKNPANFLSLDKKSSRWHLEDESGQRIRPESVSGKKLTQLECIFFTYSKEKDWRGQVFYFGRRIALPDLGPHKVVLILEELRLSFLINLPKLTCVKLQR